jgi:5'-3' exonuclease
MYKDHSTPFISDLYNFLYYNKNNFKEYIKNSDSFKKSRILSSTEQLLIVLPKKSLLNIIKEIDEKKYTHLSRVLRCNSKLITNMFPDKITIDMIHKEYLWQSRIFFNNFNIENLQFFL